MNRNSLLEVSKEILSNNKDFKAPLETKFNLPGKAVLPEMNKILDKLYNDKVILDHGLKVAQELAHVLSGGDTSINQTLSEDDLYKLELDGDSYMTSNRISSKMFRNPLAPDLSSNDFSAMARKDGLENSKSIPSSLNRS